MESLIRLVMFRNETYAVARQMSDVEQDAKLWYYVKEISVRVSHLRKYFWGIVVRYKCILKQLMLEYLISAKVDVHGCVSLRPCVKEAKAHLAMRRNHFKF